MVEQGIWFKVFTVYQKDPRLLSEWVEVVRSDVEQALEVARGLTEAEAVPDAVTLGFSPQILLAAAAVRYPRGLSVVTSPEVAEGSVPPARFSHELLKALSETGFISDVLVVPMAPKPTLPPPRVVAEVREVIESISPKALDISGGTQLVAIAAAESGAALTYTYPLGKVVRIFLVRP